jgi:hypothetical protein
MTDQTTDSNEIVRESWARGWAVFNELLVHTLVIIFVIGSIKAIELVVEYANHHDEVLFFRGSKAEFPAQWLFDAADVAMITCLLFRGVVSAYQVYKGAKK